MSDLPDIKNGASALEISYEGDPLSHFQRLVSWLSFVLFVHIISVVIVNSFRSVVTNCNPSCVTISVKK